MANPLSIWLADDDGDDREVFREVSAELGVDLSEFADGYTLLSRAKEMKTNFPDFLFLDLNLPIENGLECLRKIRAMGCLQTTKVFIYTTVASPTEVHEAIELGAVDVLLKPSSVGALKLMIQAVLKKHSNYFLALMFCPLVA